MDGEKDQNKLAEEQLIGNQSRGDVLFGVSLTAGYSASKRTLWRLMPPAEPRLLPHQFASTSGDPPSPSLDSGLPNYSFMLKTMHWL